MVLKAPDILRTNDNANVELHVFNDNDHSVQVEIIDDSKGDSTIIPLSIEAHSSQKISQNIQATRESYIIAYTLMNKGKAEQRLVHGIKVIDNSYYRERLFELDSQGSLVFDIHSNASGYTIELQNPPSFNKGLESYLLHMMREPHGCFEQVSTTNYPNILAYQLLLAAGHKDSELASKHEYLVSGYKQLLRYETATGGFSWFGEGAGNEALTAMGLLQFMKLKACNVEVDTQMFSRTMTWLKKRQEKNYFIQSQGKYGFANITPDIAHAYITYVLSEMGDTSLQDQVNYIKQGITNPYNMALLCAILIKEKRSTEYGVYLEELKTIFEKLNSSGELNIPYLRSLVNSGTQASINETFAILATAIYRNRLSDEYAFAGSICRYLNKQDKYSWGNMQTMAFVLEAFCSQLIAIPRSYTGDPFKITFSLNGFGDTIILAPGQSYTIDKPGIATTTHNKLQVKFANSGYLQVHIQESGLMPFNTPKTCEVALKAEFSKPNFLNGEIARYDLTFANKTTDVLPQTVAVIAIPSGMNINPEELLFLTREKKCDFYEIRDQILYLYWEEIKPAENIVISLLFTCEISGSFTPASCYVYKYYQPERKTFYLPAPLVIR